MNCTDFKQIADSYLSDELLVETNHNVLRHLDNCLNCRAELAGRREIREKVRAAVRNDSRNRLNPGFSARLENGLREQAFKAARPSKLFGIRFALAGMAAAVLIAVFVGVIMRKSGENLSALVKETPVSSESILSENDSFPNPSFIRLRNDAVEDHKHCALTHDLEEEPISLEEASRIYGSDQNGFDSAVIDPLNSAFGDSAKFLAAHFCIVNGRRFSHVVVQYKNKVISVLLTKRDYDRLSESDARSCSSAEDLRVACFESGKYSVFVVSDLVESENLLLAQAISPSVKKHIGQKI